MEILIPEAIEVEKGEEGQAITEIKAFFRKVYLAICEEKGLEGGNKMHPAFKIDRPDFLTSDNESRQIFILKYQGEVVALVTETRNNLKLRFQFFLKNGI
jgi:hypothetical protein